MKNEQASRPFNEGNAVNRMVADIPETRGMPINGMTQVAPASTGTTTTTTPAGNNTPQSGKQGS